MSPSRPSAAAPEQEGDPATAPRAETSPLNTAGRTTQEANGYYIVGNPRTGALSALGMAEMLAFERLESGGGATAAIELFRSLGHDEAVAIRHTDRLLARLETEGWMRPTRPATAKPPLDAVYLTVTRECNLACPYCYQGLSDRKQKQMPLAQVTALLDRIAALNEQAHIIVTGGEPLLHPELFPILDAIAERGLSLSLLTNGVHLDEAAAERLKGYRGLERVQVSIDGIRAETHALSRGPNSFDRTVEAIERLARHGLPLLLAPTIHDGNADEIVPLARWALELGGSISANDLRHLPGDANGHLTLADTTLSRIRAELRDLLLETAHHDPRAGDRITRLSTRSCSTEPVNARFLCGVAHSLVDIDWNGDVFPCHMLKGDDLKLGNALEEPFEAIFARGVEGGWRTPSYAIEGCDSCMFVSTCASGCRAKTFHSYGTPVHRSPTCEENGRRLIADLLKMRGARAGGE